MTTPEPGDVLQHGHETLTVLCLLANLGPGWFLCQFEDGRIVRRHIDGHTKVGHCADYKIKPEPPLPNVERF